MLKFLLSALAIVFTGYLGWAQTNSETFESNPSFIPVGSNGFGFVSTGSGAFITGSTTSGNRPASVPYSNAGSSAYSLTSATLGNTATLTSANLNTVGTSFAALQFRLQAISLNTTDGLDQLDYVRVEISPNGGTTWFNTLEVHGGNELFANSYWSYAATGVAQTNYDGNTTPVDVFAPANGNNPAGPSTVIVRGLPVGIPNLRVRITMYALNFGGAIERWVIDDVQLLRTSGGPLPVNFANVQARAEGLNTTISWSNLTESDVDYYAVERSADGRNFEVIGKLQPKANNYSKQDYSYIDHSSLAAGFYRVKAVEFNTTTKTSVILRVNSQNRGRKGGFHVYPNPVQGGVVSLQAGDLEKGAYSVRMFHTNGQLVYSRVLQLQGGTISQSLELPSKLQSGMYLMQIEGAGSKQSLHIYVQ
jgi:hypothetical protein